MNLMTDTDSNTSLRKRLEGLLSNGQDNALLRYSLGLACMNESDFEEAAKHLAKAVARDPNMSAAWKVYGRVHARLGRVEEAKASFKKGLSVARRQGDRQAEKEIGVFLKRLDKEKSAR